MPDLDAFTTIDLNILPEAYRRKGAKPVVIALGALAGVLFMVAVASFVVLQINRRQAQDLQAALVQSQETLATIRTPAPEILELTEQLASDTTAVQVLTGLQPTLEAGVYDWRAIFDTVLQYDATVINLLEATQDESDLRISGNAGSQDAVLAYAGTLDRSGVFEQVIVQSMEGIEEPLPPGITPTAGVTATAGVATPIAPTATTEPTASPYDAYEIDDFSPHRIFPGEVQRHSFSPLYDADQVEFLGKAGRRYCVQALPQAAGVDTMLQVTLGGVTYENDDCHPNEVSLLVCRCPTETITGSLASLVEVQVPDGSDQMVNVRVTNRGQYGPEQWYDIQVNEVGGDAYESDDYIAKAIAIGEMQRRTFYPDGDVDRVTFPVKGGHAYELRTNALGVGVDTVVTVYLAGSTYQDDDVGPGDLSSSLRFQTIADGQATAVITNKGLFGTSMSYLLELHEVGGDPYEPDDYVPQTLSPYEQQARTFFPEGDIDRVEFNVKAGRIYEVKTYSLTVGVDTSLVLLVDGQRYENDDVGVGDPSSRVVFQAQNDGVAGVTVTNREQYGAYNSYSLTLTELSATPIPTATSAAPLGTPTPDCGDAFEPDDAVGRQVLVGENQDHNFCPTGDVDRIVFTAKAGYAYRIETTNLALGVDTHLTVQIGGSVMSNDDRSPQDLSSVVEVQNLTGFDAPIFCTIANKGPLYAEDQTYTVSISDLGAGDAFEVDDLDPAPISTASGTSQTRTFYPPGDIDKATFVAKAQHRYRISTANLAALVDTVLDVDFGGTNLSNDDRAPGDLASELSFVNGGVVDSLVVVTVANQGEYGPDRGYELLVEDLGVGETFEPDDLVAADIAVGDSQDRTFSPDGDIDSIRFMAEPYHVYQVLTSNLSAGVDTDLEARIAWRVYSNDDVAPGDLSSSVAFQSYESSAAEVVVTISNHGSYGPGQTYTVTVLDLGLGDTFELDDVVSASILVGLAQERAFYPSGDVDRAVFTAKAGYAYRIETTDLAVGVDTDLSVQIGADTFTNDDAVPQDLSSMLEVTNGTMGDLPVYITVMNKGPWGVDKTYQLQVTNLTGGDAGDAFEPDDETPQRIAFGVAQEHSFAPEDDVDKVIFDTDPQHLYVIYTFGLATGVDTMLGAEVDVVDGLTHRTQYKANDDVTAGDPSSSIQFWYEGSDPGSVEVTVSQQGNYGIDKTYFLQVDDLGAGDSFEPDDGEAIPIAIGEEGQSRTFYPTGDIDRVWFTAKAGHRYSIETKDLTGLVDTSLIVDMGAIHLSNDDHFHGTLASYIELHNSGLYDSRADVLIANKGPYSMDGSYVVVVKDQGTEAGDEYEPDLVNVHWIAPGEAQRHSFHPEGDVDRVFMQVKAGRRYVLYTCGSETLIGDNITSTEGLDCDVLPPGTDTVVGVSGPVTHCTPAACESDDAFAGTGYLNSRLFFEALVDGVVTVNIHNNGLYGPDKVYYLVAEEQSYVGAPTPALTPAPLYSPTPSPTWTLAPPPTPTETPAPYIPPVSPVPPPTPTATPAPYSMPLDEGRSRLALVTTRGEGATMVPTRLRVPLISKPLLKPVNQQAQSGKVRFVMMLKLRRGTP